MQDAGLQVPDVCSAEFKARIAQNFALPQQPYPANDTLMEGQEHMFGGIATRPPPQLPRSYPSTPVIQVDAMQPPATPVANAANAFTMLRPFSVPHPAVV